MTLINASQPDPAWLESHTEVLARSYKRFTGRDLCPAHLDVHAAAEWLMNAPFVVLSHGTEADPVLNYGNRAALKLWEMEWEEFVRTPSRYTAEAPNREARARLLAEAAANGFIDNYSGVRISKSGRRFYIERATIWNLVSKTGAVLGQAATFSGWRDI
jgi:hypothetical protein